MKPLTEKHLLTYLNMNHFFPVNTLSQEQIASEKEKLISLYHDDPKGTLKMLEEHLNNNPQLKKYFGNLTQTIIDDMPVKENKTSINPDLPQGFKQFRKQLTKQQIAIFNNKNTNKTRSFLRNKQLRYEKIQNYGNFGSSTIIEIIQLCGDGTFTYLTNNGISAQVDEVSGISQDKDVVNGFWDIGFENKALFLGLYSTNPQFLEITATGYLMMHLKNIENTVVRIAYTPKDKLYRITQINCN